MEGLKEDFEMSNIISKNFCQIQKYCIFFELES